MIDRLFIALALALAFFIQNVGAAESSEIRVAAPWEISGPDPSTDGFVFLRMGVLETLVSTSESGNLQPGLAENWSTTSDGLTWRFTLREATFHDGTPLTSDAAVTALQRAVSNPGPLGKVAIDSIEADGRDVLIKLTSPFLPLPAVLSHSSTVIPAPSSFDPNGKVLSAIGTGAFRVNELKPPQSLTTARFDGYWGEKAEMASASYLAVKRAETRALMAESGDADIVFTLDPAGFKNLKSVDSLKAVSVAIPRVMLIKVNAGHSMLGDETVREALSLAVDREGIAAGITRYPEAAATQTFPPGLGDWHNAELPALAYDPQRAKSLLAKAGWSAGEDGILVRDGKRFSLTMRTFPDRPELPLVAAAIQDQWREIGIELNVSVANYSEIPKGHQDGSLEVALFARNYGSIPDPYGSVLSDFGAGGGDWGSMNWDNPEVVAALGKIANTDDESVRTSLIKEIGKAIHTDLPMIPVVWYQHTVAYKKGLEDIVIDPLERSYGLNLVNWAQ
ncbi:MAG: ABC transporter substrate-binding protein [Pseudomonadota bacterium]